MLGSERGYLGSAGFAFVLLCHFHSLVLVYKVLGDTVMKY